VKHIRRTGIVLSLSIVAHLGCSDAESDAPDGPRFTGLGTPSSPSPAAPGTTVGGTPGARASGTPGTSPTPAAERPPATSGLDTSGAGSSEVGSSSAGASVTATSGTGAGGTGAGGTGAGGTGTSGTAGAPASPAEPAAPTPAPTAGPASPGCGRSQGTPTNVAIDSTIMTFPIGYDGSTPVPLVFAFHGANRTNLDQQTVDSRTIGSELEQNYVMAFVKSAGAAWDLGTDYPRFQAIRTQILSQFCIDSAHVFAFGHSSGAQFIAQMLGDSRSRETGLAAVAPVSSSDYGNPAWSPVPTLLIHGLRDTQRPNDGNGAQDISQYAESNQCPGGTTPLALATCNSIADRSAVNPGCVQYNGCAAPTLFCNHNDPNYIANGSPTNHGWPCFANSEIFQFFESQR
jgi:polyhydroxybutyrate depolymerase